MPNETLLDRATYKKIKSFDRVQMDNFIKDIYKSAAEEADTAVDMDKLRKEIGAIKGVGESRLNEIKDIIERHLA
ncbi:MAG: hypothetical protein ACI4J7_09650 [Ruminiclostridium sp.]